VLQDVRVIDSLEATDIRFGVGRLEVDLVMPRRESAIHRGDAREGPLTSENVQLDVGQIRKRPCP